MSAPKRINLLVNEGFENTTAGKMLAWALSAGRTIVIITELVVIVAFLSRFWLDRSLTDLNDQNNTKKSQIESAGSFEKDFRNVQNRLIAYKQLTASKTDGALVVKSISSSLPSDVYLTEIFLNKGVLILNGNALTESGLGNFMQALEGAEKIESVKLKDLRLSGSVNQSLEFSIGAEVK